VALYNPDQHDGDTMNDDEMKQKVETMTLERYGRAFTFVLVLAILVLLVIEIFSHRHGELDIEDMFFFPAAFGFCAFIFIVMMGKLLRHFIMRPEDYYQNEEAGRDDT
jgi:hypothetical protein